MLPVTTQSAPTSTTRVRGNFIQVLQQIEDGEILGKFQFLVCSAFTTPLQWNREIQLTVFRRLVNGQPQWKFSTSIMSLSTSSTRVKRIHFSSGEKSML